MKMAKMNCFFGTFIQSGVRGSLLLELILPEKNKKYIRITQLTL